jgi:hypothetical protein
LRRLGIGRLLSGALSLVINGALGRLTQKRWSLTVSVNGIGEGLHAYDTGVFQPSGAADPAVLDRLLREAGGQQGPARPSDSVTRAELNRFIRAAGDRGRPFGTLGRWFSARETQLLLCLAADTTKGGEPAITRRQLERLYSGELLFLLARRRRIQERRAALYSRDP